MISFYNIFEKIIGKGICEATYSEIGRKQLSITKLFPTFPERMKAVQDRGGVHLVDTDKSILHFKVHSGTKDLWYENGIQFKGLTNILKNLIYLDRSVWKEDR